MIFKSLVVGQLEVNCFILACEKTREGIIIDPGDNASEILHQVKENNIKIVEVIATHGHFDHIGRTLSVVEETRAQFSIHKDDLKMVNGLVDIAAFFGIKTDPPPKIDRFLTEGDTVLFGTTTLQVLHVPGHSPGNIALVWPGHAIVGDTLFAGSIGRTDLEGSNPNLLLKKIREKLLPLGDNTKIYPGHGPFTTIGQERQTNPFLNDIE